MAASSAAEILPAQDDLAPSQIMPPVVAIGLSRGSPPALEHKLGSGGTRVVALQQRGLPGAGIKPTPPALAGSTEPPGKPLGTILINGRNDTTRGFFLSPLFQFLVLPINFCLVDYVTVCSLYYK